MRFAFDVSLALTFLLSLSCAGDNRWDRNGGEGDPCDAPGDCAHGLTCIEGLCAGPEADGDVDVDADSDADGDPACPDERRCGIDCCTADEECLAGECLAYCESGLRCGPEHECCGDEELCLENACVSPGDPCIESIDCPESFYCDPTLERCLPRGEARCEYYPPSAECAPTEEWSWGASDVSPDSIQVMMAPTVGDLDGDEIPEVVFNTYTASGGYGGAGVLRIVRGDTGEEVRSITTPVVCPESGIALGDLEGDGEPEIVTTGPCMGPLLAFHMDGSLIWRSHHADGSELAVSLEFGAPTIADLEGDGLAEVVVGAAVFEHDGSLRWSDRFVAGYNCCSGSDARAAVTAVYDIDGDRVEGVGTLEIVAGNAVWDADGTPLWSRPELLDGYVAVADFFEDGIPDIAVVHNGNVSIRRGTDGEVLWGPIALPGGGRGGPPTIADFDGDGLPEIGVAGASRYAVFDPDGAAEGVLWSFATEDDSSNITGSSVFDFDGDGSAEVVYNDECYMRVFSGIDGTILASVAQNSHTLIEYPLIVDVDADGNAEIVFAANSAVHACSQAGGAGYDGLRSGIRVFGDALDNWVGTRRVWNQHTYHITNVSEDLSIPTNERPNWLGFNNFRQNPQNYDAPDLVPADFTVDVSACPPARFEAVVENHGAASVGPGLAVTFYIGTPEGEHRAAATVLTSDPIPPRGSVTVSAAYDPLEEELGEALDIFIRVDDTGDGTGEQNECDETNNTAEGQLMCAFVG